jgi:hypothetical protein
MITSDALAVKKLLLQYMKLREKSFSRHKRSSTIGNVEQINKPLILLSKINATISK